MYIDKTTTEQMDAELKKVRGRRKPKTTELGTVMLQDLVGQPLDQIYPERLDFTKYYYYEIKVSPVNSLEEVNKYFRLGFKFSKSGWPAMVRTSKNYALWHLTKNEDASLVGCTYYNEDGEEQKDQATIIFPDFNEAPITFYLYLSPPRGKDDEPDSVSLLVKHEDKYVYHREFSLVFHSYAWLTAFADSKLMAFDVSLSRL